MYRHFFLTDILKKRQTGVLDASHEMGGGTSRKVKSIRPDEARLRGAEASISRN